MEIPASLFFFVWALIGPIFLYLGFCTLDTTDLSSSVPPLVMSLFKDYLETILLLSTLSALKRHHLNIELNKCSYTWTVSAMDYSVSRDAILEASCIVCILWKKMAELSYQYYFFPNMNIFIFRYSLTLGIGAVSPLISPYVLMILYGIGSLLIEDDSVNPPLHMYLRIELMLIDTLHSFLVHNLLLWSGARIIPMIEAVFAEGKESKLPNFIGFTVCMLGSLLFQNFFRLTSFSQVVAFFYLAVAWLAIMVLFCFPYDIGVLNYLLGNVVVGCAVGQLHLQSKTWLVYAASVLLYGLHLKLLSLIIVRRPNQQPQVILW